MIKEYLLGVAAHLDLRIYGEPVVFAPASDGRAENAGFDAFVPLIDSGISGYFWTGPKFLSVVLYIPARALMNTLRWRTRRNSSRSAARP